MNKIYVCGDSFGTTDPEYPGQSWIEKFEQKIGIITNLSSVCASNLLISLQVEKAIANSADFIIYLATSCTRNHVQINNSISLDLLSKFDGKDLICYSLHSINDTTPFTDAQKQILKRYHTEFFNLDLAIYESRLIIEHTLQKLVNSKIPFIFDQGGFEHPSFSGHTHKYFDNYLQYKSQYCLWDYAIEKRPYRPYFHITDVAITDTVADYYYQQIMKNRT